MDLKKLSKEVDRRIRLSSGFAGSGTKAMESHEKEVEGGSMDAEQLEGAIQKRLKKLGAVSHGSPIKTYSANGAKIEIYKDSSGLFGALVTLPSGKQRSNGQDFSSQAQAESYANQAAKG